jgi:tetratricopeptide (TPR) repeat protein
VAIAADARRRTSASFAMRLSALIAGAIVCAGLALRQEVAAGDPTEDDSSASKLDPDYAAGKKAIEAKNWDDAIRLLSSAALRDTRNADIQNYLGYAYRHSGQLDLAFKHYERALQINPRHRGAHEYIGEAYLMVNKPAKAEEHLAALQRICLIPCEEYEDLSKEIAEYRRRDR